jgi:beta-galactosidase
LIKWVPCPTATNQLKFKVTGAGTYRANGDATSLEMFHKETMKLLAEVSSACKIYNYCGDVKLEVNGAGLKSGKLNLVSTK